jgi:hypothetical protein
MMRCKMCDAELSDYEATRKDPNDGQYLDTCSECLKAVRECLQEFEMDTYKHDIGIDIDEEI